MKKKKHPADRAIGAMSFPLEQWGVKEDEVLRTVISWTEVATIYGKRRWSGLKNTPNADPRGIVRSAIAVDAGLQLPKKLRTVLTYSAEITEQAIFAVYRSDIVGLAEAVKGCRAVHARFEADPIAFWKRLAKYAEQKTYGSMWEQKQHEWVRSAIKYWIVAPRRPDCQNSPPMCLWADSVYSVFFDNVPEDSNSVRKILKNHGLYRPEGIAYRIRGNKWVRCRRAHWAVTNPLKAVPDS